MHQSPLNCLSLNILAYNEKLHCKENHIGSAVSKYIQTSCYFYVKEALWMWQSWPGLETFINWQYFGHLCLLALALGCPNASAYHHLCLLDLAWVCPNTSAIQQPKYRERKDNGLFITLVLNVFLFVGLTTLRNFVNFDWFVN